jgi:hypothetical protein
MIFTALVFGDAEDINRFVKNTLTHEDYRKDDGSFHTP